MLSRLLHVAVLCSKRAPGLQALLHHPEHGMVFSIDCVVSSEAQFSECGVPVITHPIQAFYEAAHAWIGDRSVRRAYDARTAKTLAYMGCDVVLTLGYTYLLTQPMLEVFPNSIFNVHDSDLNIRKADGRPKYAGLHATREAILAGEKETRSSLHLVTPDIDSGPVIARSEAFPVAPFARDAAMAGHHDIVRAYAYAQREWMMRRSWADLIVTALEQISMMKEAIV